MFKPVLYILLEMRVQVTVPRFIENVPEGMTHRGLFIFLSSSALIIYCCISIDQIHTAGRVFPHSPTNLLGADSAFEESLCAPIPILVKGRKRKKKCFGLIGLEKTIQSVILVGAKPRMQLWCRCKTVTLTRLHKTS